MAQLLRLALLVIGLGPAAANGAPAPGVSPGAAVTASNRFGFQLYAQISRERGNVICSPASASIVLSMVAAGARGQTLAEILHVLHVDPAQWPRYSSSFSALVRALNDGTDRGGLALHVAGRVWGQRDFPFAPEFVEELSRDYDAPLGLVDFQGAPEAARVDINRWAASQTHGLMSGVLRPGDLDTLTRLVLTNALYFQGRWGNRFNPRLTSAAPFAAPSGRRLVATMKLTTALRYAKVDDVALVELPYRGGVSMLVVLPDGPDGLRKIESQLAARYDGWRLALANRYVDVQLPRWNTRASFSLRDALAAMGMPTAFSAAADFSEALTKPGLLLAVTRVLQQAFIKVDETGTQAAAVTVGEIGLMGKATAVPVLFHADRPFLYILADQQTGAVLFIGRVMDPGKGTNH